MSDPKLQRQVHSKDLDIEATIKAGLTLEQSKLKLENMNSGKKAEKNIQALNVPSKKKAVKTDCEICTFPTHNNGKCPAKELDCFDCGKTVISVEAKSVRKRKK